MKDLKKKTMMTNNNKNVEDDISMDWLEQLCDQQLEKSFSDKYLEKEDARDEFIRKCKLRSLVGVDSIYGVMIHV